MRPIVLILLSGFVLSCGRAAEPASAAALPKPTEVLALMERVADWQLADPAPLTPSNKTRDSWVRAAGYAGIMALGDISGSPRFHDAMLKISREMEWKPKERIYHADDIAVSQTYLELFFRERDPAMLQPTIERLDYILAHPMDDNLAFVGPQKNDRWAWCDALFMGPPTWLRLWAATGKQAYLDYMVTNWWKTSAYLYDKDEHLYFRDSTYFDKKEANGKKVFWSRGNGWVHAGLVRVLQYLPANHPARPKFEQQFREMSARLVALQSADGFWHASLLDPASYPAKEASGTAFFTYGLLWGVNQGLLDRATYLPPALKAWTQLVGCVQADGRLTHVQPIGSDPKSFDQNATEPYGVGAFLLAGSELYRMGVHDAAPAVMVSVRNGSAQRRALETVEVDVAALKKLGRGPYAVLDHQAARVFPSQWLDLDANGTPEKLIFQVDVAAGDTRTFRVVAASALAAVPPVRAKTRARFVPERFDDFAWESDRVAHRMYGPAVIKAEKLISSGIDVWTKRTRALVVDKWYAAGDYHKDHGEGMDYYKVGPQRGCGGLGAWDEAARKLFVSGNYVSWRVLADGPIRSVFELNYDAWDAAGKRVTETKRVSIDAGSNFTRFEIELKPVKGGVGAANAKAGAAAAALTLAAGISDRGGSGGVWEKQAGEGVLAYWEPEVPNSGRTGCAVVIPGGAKEFVAADGNQLATAAAETGKPFVYFIGAGWSKSGDFADEKAWFAHVRDFAARVKAPVAVSVE